MRIILQILTAFVFLTLMVEAQDCKSTININTSNSDILVFIDDQYAGNGSLSVSIEMGKHKIKIKEPGIRWDARSAVKEITIDDCSTEYNISMNLEKEILLQTDPDDVYVYEGDKLLGNTPLLLSRSIETVKLKKEDYRTANMKLSQVNFNHPVKLDFTGELKSKNFTETPYFGLLIGTAVGLGAVAAYYKIQADQSYDKYEETKERKYLDDTNSFDNISGIAFGALQINFGALIYFLLSDQ